MSQGLAALAAAAALCGAGLLYLASPNQQWRLSNISGQWPRWAGFGLIAVSLVLLWQIAGWASTVFILVTILMLSWSIPPLVIAWLQARKGNSE